MVSPWMHSTGRALTASVPILPPRAPGTPEIHPGASRDAVVPRTRRGDVPRPLYSPSSSVVTSPTDSRSTSIASLSPDETVVPGNGMVIGSPPLPWA